MRRLVAVFVSCFFVFSGLVVASPALALEGEAADVFAARVIAKSSGARVLVSNLLDEFSTTYVNPDGTLTTDSYGSAIRVRDDRTSSGWRDLDYDLAFKADGSVSPKSGLFSLFISGGIGGLTSGAIEADNRGLKGSKRTAYMLESAALGAISSGFGFSAARGIGLAALNNRWLIRKYAMIPSTGRHFVRDSIGEMNSQISQKVLDLARSVNRG